MLLLTKNKEKNARQGIGAGGATATGEGAKRVSIRKSGFDKNSTNTYNEYCSIMINQHRQSVDKWYIFYSFSKYMKLNILQITDLPTSTYHTAKYDSQHYYIAGSDRERKKIIKTKSWVHSAQWILYHINGIETLAYKMDTDMLYIVEVISPDILFLWSKIGKNTFQLFSISQKKIIKQKTDKRGNGCYGTLYSPEHNELIMNTRNGILQIVDANDLTIKDYIKLTPWGERLWQIYYDKKNDIIFTSDYLGHVYKVQKTWLHLIKQAWLSDLYNHNDNHDLPASIWWLAYHNDKVVTWDRFWWVTIRDDDLNILSHYRLKRDGTHVTDPHQLLNSSEMESIMSLKILDEQYFLLGTRWWNVFLCDMIGNLEKILSVPMGIQKENSAFTMERVDIAGWVEVLITFWDGQVYSVQYSYTKE